MFNFNICIFILAHAIGGFLESFGPSVANICRFCDAAGSDIQVSSESIGSQKHIQAYKV